MVFTQTRVNITLRRCSIFFNAIVGHNLEISLIMAGHTDEELPLKALMKIVVHISNWSIKENGNGIYVKKIRLRCNTF